MAKKNINGDRNPNYKGGVSAHPIYQILIRIKRCKEGMDSNWRENSKEFIEYWEKEGWEKGLTVVRIDENKGFHPDNCKLMSRGEISANIGRKSALKTKGRKRSKETNDKICATNMKRYGVPYPLMLKEIQDKCKESIFTKYGVKSAAVLESVKETTVKNNREKYGVDYPQQLPENREKFRQLTIDSGQAYYFDGKTSVEMADEIGVSRACMCLRIRKYGYEKALSMDNGETSIEFDIKSMLENLNINFRYNKKVGKYFPDFILDDYNLIIECDGLYWHSDAINKDKKYHRNKKEVYKEEGFNSLFFREDEINDKFNIVSSIIKNKLKMSDKIFARKCVIKEVDKKEGKEHFIENHLMGKGQGKIYGLYYCGDLYTAIQVVNRKEYIDVSRFCHKLNYTVIGGFTKLIKHVIGLYNPNHIQTFVDQRYGSGEYMTKFGFKLINNDISFRWVKDDKTYHRLKYKGNSGYNNRMYKLWDCGQAKYVLKNPALTES